jgi:hypothetical protein
MSLVGEVLLSARELMTDLPQSLTAPNLVSAVGATIGGGALPIGTYVCYLTTLNAFGESALSSSQSAVLSGGNNAITITWGSIPGSNGNVRVYISIGGVVSYYVPVTGPGGTFSILSTATAVPCNGLPNRATGYLPDTDGQAVSAYAIYRWFNQALEWAAAKNRGGLPDFGGAGTVTGVGNYVMNGYWKKIDNGWYDGYPLGLLSKNNVFRRNPVTGYAGSLTIFQATDRLMVELWPQPARTSGQTTLASPMLITDTTASLTSAAGFVLGFGLVQIGTEIMYYSAISGNTLTGLTRGMNGTVAAAQASSAAVTELNLMISGFRVPANYSVGQSTSTLYLPPGWDEALVSYLLYRFRSAEQDDKAAQRYLSEAEKKMSDLGANRIIAGPRQVQPYGTSGPDTVYGRGSVFGGVILP